MFLSMILLLSLFHRNKQQRPPLPVQAYNRIMSAEDGIESFSDGSGESFLEYPLLLQIRADLDIAEDFFAEEKYKDAFKAMDVVEADFKSLKELDNLLQTFHLRIT